MQIYLFYNRQTNLFVLCLALSNWDYESSLFLFLLFYYKKKHITFIYCCVEYFKIKTF